MAMESADAIRSIFVTGLCDAHALENQALSLMNRQIDRLEQILTSLGESPSAIKDLGASFMGNMAALGHTVTGDEILKNSFANFAFENFEVASYKSLITMAEAGGFRDSVPLLQQSLREEQSMAQWLDEHLPQVTTRYMELYVSGDQASR